MGGSVYYGADCVNRLAMLSSRRGWFKQTECGDFQLAHGIECTLPVDEAWEGKLCCASWKTKTA